MNKPIVAELRQEAIDRLSTIISLPSPEKRHAQAEWIVDAILRAAAVDVTQRMLDAQSGPCGRPPGAIHEDPCKGCGYSIADHAKSWSAS